MRLHRLVIRNYRGVQECEVEVASQGVTVIVGPNEIGKSSLAEAINLLLDQPDSSAKRQVKAVKPVNRDAGPEVELEFTTGPYRAVYKKRWLVKPETVLTVRGDKSEQLTGRPAHDRMKEILDETLDEALWAALRYQQGESVTQAALGGCRTLSAALDASATGGAPVGEEDDGLWARIESERALYFTGTGKANGDRSKLQAAVDELAVGVSRLQEDLLSLESAAERHRDLGVELAELETRKVGQERIVDEHKKTVADITAKQQALTGLGLKTKEAELTVRDARAAADRRAELVRALKDASETLSTLVEVN